MERIPFKIFMLFLPLVCGFLVEYQLEHIIVCQREKIHARQGTERILGMTSLRTQKDEAIPEAELSGLNSAWKESWKIYYL